MIEKVGVEAMLVEAIKEQQNQIQVQENEIIGLKMKNTARTP